MTSMAIDEEAQSSTRGGSSERDLLPPHETTVDPTKGFISGPAGYIGVIPTGRYRAQVITAEAKVSKTDMRYVLMKLEIEDGEYRGYRLSGVIVPDFWLGERAITALGLTSVEDNCSSIAAMAPMRRVGIDVRLAEYSGLARNDIRNYLGWGEV